VKVNTRIINITYIQHRTGCWSDGLELTAVRWTQRSGVWCRQLQTVL